MKNIVIYIGSIYFPDKSAGAQRAFSLSKTFRDLGYKVVLIGIDTDIDKNIPILETRKEYQGFETYSIPNMKSISQWVEHTISIKRFIEVFDYFGEENIHSILALEYEAIPLLKLNRYCKKNNIYLIADAEEWYGRSKLRFPFNIAKDIDTYLRMYYVYPYKIKNMICISRFFQNHYKKIKNTVYIPGTIDRSEKKWSEIEQYVPCEPFTIGYAGSPGIKFEKERLDWLILAVCELNEEGYDCQLKIAGIERQFIDNIIPDIKNNVHYNSKVEFMGRLNHIDCLKMISSCDFSAIVRENKRVTKAGFPTKFSESLGCGTPVITTNTSNLSEYIIEGYTGFLCKEFSKDSLKETIKKAMSINKNELSEIHRKLKESDILNYDKFIKDLSKFINSLSY